MDNIMLAKLLFEVKEIRDSHEFSLAKARLLGDLRTPRVPRLPSGWEWITGVWRSGMMLGPEAPFGWAWDMAHDRDLARLTPLWIHWPRRLLAYRWRAYRILYRAGFLVGPEGVSFGDLRWAWRFWRSQRALLGVGLWQRLCYALLRVDARFLRDVPRWT